MVDLVIFDLDGTLIDSEPNYFAAEQRLLEEIGISGFDEEAKRPYIGMSTREILLDLVGGYGLAETVDELAARKDVYYLELARTRTRVFTPMARFADLLAQQKYRLALASGSSAEAIGAVLEITGLAPLFELAMSADAVADGKPAPDLFLAVAAQLGVKPEDCVVVEDSYYGREAARRAGMRCVFVPGLPDQVRHAEELDGELVVVGGMGEFVPEDALGWVRGGGTS